MNLEKEKDPVFTYNKYKQATEEKGNAPPNEAKTNRRQESTARGKMEKPGDKT